MKDRSANKSFKALVATIYGVLKSNRDMRIEVRGFPQRAPMKRIKPEGLNNPSQNICLLILYKTLLTKELPLKGKRTHPYCPPFLLGSGSFACKRAWIGSTVLTWV